MSSEDYEENTVPSLTPFAGKSPGGGDRSMFLPGVPSPSSPNRPSRKRSSLRKNSCLYTKTPTPFAQGSSPTNIDVIANLREGHGSNGFIANPTLSSVATAALNMENGAGGQSEINSDAVAAGGNEPTVGILGDQSTGNNPQAGTATCNKPNQYTLEYNIKVPSLTHPL